MEYADNYSQSKHFLKRCLAGHFLQSGKVIGTSIGRRRSESPQGIGFHRRHPRFRNHHRKRCKRTDTRPDLFCRKPETTGREPDCHQPVSSGRSYPTDSESTNRHLVCRRRKRTGNSRNHGPDKGNFHSCRRRAACHRYRSPHADRRQ